MSRRMLLLTALALAVGFAPAPLPRRPRGDSEASDLRKMQGAWVPTRYEYAGKNILHGEVRYEITGNRIDYWYGGQKSTWTFELNAATAPRQMTSTRVQPSPAVWLGIYRFEGDNLIICEELQKGPRPTQFDSRGNRNLVILKRDRGREGER